jgi:hypothetical protein
MFARMSVKPDTPKFGQRVFGLPFRTENRVTDPECFFFCSMVCSQELAFIVALLLAFVLCEVALCLPFLKLDIHNCK